MDLTALRGDQEEGNFIVISTCLYSWFVFRTKLEEYCCITQQFLLLPISFLICFILFSFALDWEELRHRRRHRHFSLACSSCAALLTQISLTRCHIPTQTPSYFKLLSIEPSVHRGYSHQSGGKNTARLNKSLNMCRFLVSSDISAQEA